MRKIKELDCILLIDDEESNNFLNRLLIEQIEIDVCVQETLNGLEAVDFLTCNGKFLNNKKYPQPGIILLDINMPRMNGWEFLEEYEKFTKDQKGKIIIVMLTSSSNQDDIDRAFVNKNTNGFMSKPLSKKSLTALIEKHFEKIN